MANDRDFALISGPENADQWPVPPEYVPLWNYARVQTAFEALIVFRGHEAMPVMNQDDAMRLMLQIVHEYDLALSKARFDLWAARGMGAVSLNALS